MGLIRWLMQRLGWRSSRGPVPTKVDSQSPFEQASVSTATLTPPPLQTIKRATPRGRARLVPSTRVKSDSTRPSMEYVETEGEPYKYARYGSQTGRYLDLSRDVNEARLAEYGLPVLRTPDDLANWIGLPLNKVAWLVHRFSAGRPASVKDSHYHFHWLKKRHGGWRLIEAPKAMLKLVQTKILRELLDPIPVHRSAHGFTAGRSIITNAEPHVGQAVVLKLDLANFYTTVSFSRVVAIFRGLGYSREVAIWLGLLTTSAVPGNLGFQEQGPYAIVAYLRRHLPQGAPTSPALANLSAFGLDARISGLAKSFGATYTRYADDLTISGPKDFSHALRTIIPLVQQIVRQEQFYVNRAKRRILRSHQRQSVTGVIVNEKPNISRGDYDRLKAMLTNCLRHGPSTQNRIEVPDFYNHLRGCIAHVSMLNPARGQKLTELFQRIDWSK